MYQNKELLANLPRFCFFMICRQNPTCCKQINKKHVSRGRTLLLLVGWALDYFFVNLIPLARHIHTGTLQKVGSGGKVSMDTPWIVDGSHRS